MPRDPTSFAVLALLLLGIEGCGTIFHGTRQSVTAQSTPDGASISVLPSGGQYTTPTSLSLERKQDYHLTFSKKGYQSVPLDVEHHLNVGILLLDILAFPTGLIVDGITGAWNSLTPTTLQAALTKTHASVEGPESIRVSVAIQGGKLNIQSSEPGVGVQVEQR
jgi:hypothetical protein